MSDKRETATTHQYPNAIAVAPGSRVMHLATIKERRAGFRDARTLCGRFLLDVTEYVLEDELTLPWRTCRTCDRRRAENGSLETRP